MRIRNFSCALSAALVCGAIAGCSTDRARERDTGDSGVIEASTDSGALVSAAAQALATTLREANRGDSTGLPRMSLRMGASPWDTLLGRELERAGIASRAVVDSGASIVELHTYGIETRGDTVAVATVVRRCTPNGPTFTFMEDSLVHRLTRATGGGAVRWAVAGAVDHTHIAGTCEPTRRASPRDSL